MEFTDLARIDWQMGQVLLPEHLAALENASSADSRLRQSLTGLPGWGLCRLAYNDHQLKDGVVSLHELTALMPSGELVSLPGNAVVTPCEISSVDSARARMWLHRLRRNRRVGDPRLTPGVAGAQRKLIELEITPHRIHAEAVESLPLGTFSRDGSGRWALELEQIPPLLLLRQNPFIPPILKKLRDILEGFRAKLTIDLSNGLISGQNQAGALACLKETVRLEVLLADLRGEIDRHPYELFTAMRSFLLEVQFYQGANDAGMVPELMRVYHHDELGPCLMGTLDLITRLTSRDRVHPQLLPFERGAGMFLIQHLPEVVAEASQVYLLIQKPRVGVNFDINKVKLGAKSRLQRLHRLALIGVPMKLAEVSPFPQQFGPEVEFFLIERGDEWRHAMTERTLGFYSQDIFEGVSASLCWRFG